MIKCCDRALSHIGCAIRQAAAAASVLAALTIPGFAASLQVSPVNVEVLAPGATTTITLRNAGSEPLNAQIRVFRWMTPGGEEKLEPTEDVVASPPSATLAPGTDYTIRLVRVTKRPVAAGEAYRLLVDELPPSTVTGQRGVVTLVMRYSIPAFFYAGQTAAAKLTWSLEEHGGQSYLSVTNDGDRHMRLSALKLRDGSATAASFGDGLVGYVLGHSTARWRVPEHIAPRLGLDRPLTVTGQGDSGPINAALSTQSPR